MRSSRRTINLCTGFGNRRCFTDKIECKREWHYIQLVEGAKPVPPAPTPAKPPKPASTTADYTATPANHFRERRYSGVISSPLLRSIAMLNMVRPKRSEHLTRPDSADGPSRELGEAKDRNYREDGSQGQIKTEPRIAPPTATPMLKEKCASIVLTTWPLVRLNSNAKKMPNAATMRRNAVRGMCCCGKPGK
jgi:hypothetical protein